MSPSPLTVAYIGLGANLGDRLQNLVRAGQSVHGLTDTRLDAPAGVSSIYETTPHNVPDIQPPYLNAVLRVLTPLSADALLDELRRVEESQGRARTRRGAARRIDLDLLLYGDLVIDTPALVVPHPRMHERRFVLDPLVEIAPQLFHPVLQRSMSILWLEACRFQTDQMVTPVVSARQWLDLMAESPRVGASRQ